MPRPKVSPTDEEMEALAAAYQGVSDDVDSPPPCEISQDDVIETHWMPDHNPTQSKIFNDPAKYILAYGEKGSGKTYGLSGKLVRHCYDEHNALSLIGSPSIRTGKEGVLFDLENYVLPEWKAGIGLHHSPSGMDPNTKDRYIWILNRYGSWSKILLISLPYPEVIQSRIKAISPSHIFMDELTQCATRDYFTYPAAQLGRRQGIRGPQQYTASCNPEGPSHWVHKVFIDEPMDEDTGKRDPNFSVYHVPIKENIDRLPAGYIQQLEELFAHDPVEYDRLVRGLWVERPSGEALFRQYFIPQIHVRGDVLLAQGLRPMRGFPIIVGYDLGQVFSSVTFLQCVPTRDKTIWIVFDEIDHLGEKILYKKLVHEIMERMDYWVRLVDYPFAFEHISDDSAINQWHPGGEGSYDAWDVERFSSGRIRLRGCPKGKGSVAARVRLMVAKLMQEEIFVSALCSNTREMLLNLDSDEDDPTVPRRSKWIHKFDSVTYPMFRTEIASARNALQTNNVKPMLYRCGSGPSFLPTGETLTMR